MIVRKWKALNLLCRRDKGELQDLSTQLLPLMLKEALSKSTVEKYSTIITESIPQLSAKLLSAVSQSFSQVSREISPKESAEKPPEVLPEVKPEVSG